jgi:hypothetical protein
VRIFFTPRRSSGSSSPANPRKIPRWRRLFQFSLRSLLILTTLAAVGCWWLLQPKMREEELAGKYLKLLRHVWAMPVTDAVQQLKSAAKTPRGKSIFGNTGLGPLFNAAHDDQPGIDHGSWQIRDEHDDVLVTGRYIDGQPHGFWTIYHASGRKAAAGEMFHGLRVGLWKTWYEDGRRESEVTYAVKKVPRSYLRLPEFRRPVPRGPICTSVIPVVGMVGFSPLLAITGDDSGRLYPRPNHFDSSSYVSMRHGPAQGWFSNGKLRWEGIYDHDRRHGQWTFYDASGRITEKGEYHVGVRDGQWQIVDSATGKTKSIELVGGRERFEHVLLMAQLQAAVHSGDAERQIIAMDRLEELGQHGAPLLSKCLEDSNIDLQLLALRRLERMAIASAIERQPECSIFDAAIIARIEALLDSDDERAARSAMLLLYRVSPDRRDALFPRILSAIRQFGDSGWKWSALISLWQTDIAHRAAIFAELAQLYDGRLNNAFLFVPLPFSDDMAEILDNASHSNDPRLRRFTIEFISIVARSGQRPFVGGSTVQYAIPKQLQPIVERAKADLDPTIREAAAAVGIWPDPRLPMGQGGGTVF